MEKEGNSSGTVCIYHSNCLDGFGAATSVWMALGDQGVDYVAGVHQQDPPDMTGKDVIFVDFSYKRDVILKMAEQANSITIIDHHLGAKEDLTNLPSNVTAHFDMDRSGAMMAWQHFHPEKDIPPLIRYIQDIDLWKKEIPGSEQVISGLLAEEFEFERWKELITLDKNLEGLYRDGISIEKMQLKSIRENMAAHAYRIDIAGFNVPILNAPGVWASDAGDIMGKNEPFAVTFHDDETTRHFSLRSAPDGENVMKIAKLFGGGGHVHASGFKLDKEQLHLLKIERVKKVSKHAEPDSSISP